MSLKYIQQLLYLLIRFFFLFLISKSFIVLCACIVVSLSSTVCIIILLYLHFNLCKNFSVLRVLSDLSPFKSNGIPITIVLILYRLIISSILAKSFLSFPSDLIVSNPCAVIPSSSESAIPCSYFTIINSHYSHFNLLILYNFLPFFLIFHLFQPFL